MKIDAGSASFLAAAMLRKFEALRLTPYFCPAGKLTVGYGHVILPGEGDLREGITEQVAEALLLKDLAWALYEARRVGRVLSDGQAAALASLIFNVGIPAWSKSTIRRLVVANDMAGAAEQFKAWVKVSGEKSQGLVNRRRIEREIFEGVRLWIG